jgi:hypothetical protein
MRLHKTLKLLLLSIFIISKGLSQNANGGIVPFLKKNGLYGIVKYGTNDLMNSTSYEDIELLSNGYLKVKKDNRWGVINNNGELILPIENEIITDYINSRIITVKNGLYSMYDSKGEILLDSIEVKNNKLPKRALFEEYTEETPIFYLTDNVFIEVKTKDMYSIINGESEILKKLLDKYKNVIKVDKEGNVDIVPILIKPFDKNGMAIVKVIYESTNKSSTFYLINEYGKVYFEYPYIEDLGYGMYKIRKEQKDNYGNYLYGCVDSSNNMITPIRYKSIEPFSDSLSMVTLPSKERGFINTNGEVVIPFNSFDFIESNFSEGLLTCFKNGKNDSIFYINTKGKIQLSFDRSNIYPVIYPFKNGILIARNSNYRNPDTYFINKKGMKVFSKKEVSIDQHFIDNVTIMKNYGGLMGLIDDKGKEITPIKYSKIYYFVGDFVENNSGDDYYSNSKKLIYISYWKNEQEDKIKMEYQNLKKNPTFSKLKIMRNNLMRVNLNGEEFYVDINGKEYKYN